MTLLDPKIKRIGNGQKLNKQPNEEVMLKYPDFSKPFVIHSDASDLQLGAVISQDGKNATLSHKNAKLGPEELHCWRKITVRYSRKAESI